jgi:hypothetical protein
VFETAETDTQAIQQLGDLEQAKAELDRAEAAEEEAEERA